MQGWNDMVSQEATAEYSKNLVHFVADLRKEFALKNLPFVVGELGNGGEAKPNSGMAKFREAQNEGVKKIEKDVVCKHEGVCTSTGAFAEYWPWPPLVWEC
jgi:hypothetical protein